MRLTPKAVTLAAIMALVMSGSTPAAAQQEHPLGGTSWKLATLGGESAREVETTLVFGPQDGTIGGNGGCNSYGGAIAFEAEGIAISDIVSTLMACDGPQMAQERGFFGALQAAASLRIEDEALLLLDAQENVLATLSADGSDRGQTGESGSQAPDLAGTQWRATALGGVPTAEEVATTLLFGPDGTAGGHSGCNGYEGSFSASPDGSIAFGEVTATEIGCPDPAGAQERALFEGLEAAVSYSASAESLVLLDANGAVLARFAATSE